jgi:hypothetical protein
VPETIRVVSDGEELVLSEGEAYRIHPRPPVVEPPVARVGQTAAAKRIAVQYLGFKDVEGRREYQLNASGGDQPRRYTVSIELAAFSRRQALLQDGPDICYQKLLRELTDPQPDGPHEIEVTEGDLATYREAHAPPVRKGFSPSRTQAPPPAAENPPPPKDGEDS